MIHASAPSPAIRFTNAEYFIVPLRCARLGGFARCLLPSRSQCAILTRFPLRRSTSKGSMSRNIGGYLVELLAANGIDTVFGIPGVHNLELYRGLAAANMRHVLV